MSHRRHIKADSAVLVGIADAFVNADVFLAANHLEAFADGLHGLLPLLVADIQAAQSQHAAGIDLAFLVRLKSRLHQHLDFVAATL